MGGGHSTAAGMKGVGDFESAVRRTLRILREKLGKEASDLSHR